MEVRELIRGTVEWSRIELVAEEIATRYDCEISDIRQLEANNWLSTPLIINGRWFVKIVSRQNSLIHAIFTTGRNMGAFSSGTEGFFQHFSTPYEMATYELEATERMRESGLNVPTPVDAFEIDGLGVVMLEYLPTFQPLSAVDTEQVTQHAPEVFRMLATMHESGIIHGDLQAENVLLVDGEVYFIDATSVREGSGKQAKAYDVASALGAISAILGEKETVAAARQSYDAEILLFGLRFIDFVNIRPDHDFNATVLKGEIRKMAEDVGAEVNV
ncbi:MAG: Mn2+-dependent serine/threonine protein kinase [Haloquadratum sp. J07HQX50]|jgi:Mn2+-dependent serine/threonine protein kinase|nr:MAG: Mn2+-dependent serine/threonine protein kinase [Haloquadratum sp. J07HQX50]